MTSSTQSISTRPEGRLQQAKMLRSVVEFDSLALASRDGANSNMEAAKASCDALDRVFKEMERSSARVEQLRLVEPIATSGLRRARLASIKDTVEEVRKRCIHVLSEHG